MVSRWIALLSIAFATLLTGCAVPRQLDSQVLSVSTAAPGAKPLQGAHYRFEQLPSQAQQPGFERVEALAQAALARVGLVRDDAKASHSVQVGGGVNGYWADAWGQPVGPWGWGPGGVSVGIGVGFGGRRGGGGIGFGWPMMDRPTLYYQREVSLVMRELASGRVVYETRARQDGPWHDSDNILSTLFDAALTGFPNPPVGPRQVVLPLNQPPAGAAAGALPVPPAPAASGTAVPPAAPVVTAPRP